MRAAVLEGVQRSVPVAGHHDGHRTKTRAAITVGVGQLGFEAEKMPSRPAKDARLLVLVNVAIRIDPIGYPGEAFRWPPTSLGCNRHGVPLEYVLGLMRNAVAISVRSSPAWQVRRRSPG